MIRNKKLIILAVLGLIISTAVPAEILTELEYYHVMQIAAQVGLPRSVAHQLIYEESRGNKTARSIQVRGAYSRGLCQLYEGQQNLHFLVNKFYMPTVIANDCGTWKRFDILDPYDNALVGFSYAVYLHDLYDNWIWVFWHYNHGSIKNVSNDTRQYARRIVYAAALGLNQGYKSLLIGRFK